MEDEDMAIRETVARGDDCVNRKDWDCLVQVESKRSSVVLRETITMVGTKRHNCNVLRHCHMDIRESVLDEVVSSIL